MLRQGNTNPRVYMYRYVTEGSFDAYSWQLLETKARFISELLAGSYTERQSADIDSTVLDYAEVKALAVGDPLIKKRVECANELARYTSLQNSAIETRLRVESELSELPTRIEKAQQSLDRFEEDAQYVCELREQERAAQLEESEMSDEDKKNRDSEKRAEQKKTREALFAAIKSNVLKDSETHLMNYRGFDILLPSNMTEDRPFVWLRRSGKYYVEMGDSDSGCVRRIDNYIDAFEKHLERRRDELCMLRAREESLRTEILEDYSEKIDECRAKLERIDKKLGVKKK